MSDQKLRVGIIGIGFYAAGALIPALRETGKVDIVAISRRSPERLAKAQQELNIPEAYTDWREMLEKSTLDAVVIATPPNTHADPALAALERGLHVFVEKPLAATFADAQRIVAATAKSDRVLMVGYNARGMGSWRTVKRKLSEGAIGTLQQISVSACVDARILWQGMVPNNLQDFMDPDAFYSDVLAPGNWRTNPAIVGGGMFADIASHIQDIMLWLANGSPAQVVSFAQSTASPTIISALAHLDNGVLLSIAFNDSVSGGETFSFYGEGRMTLYGNKGLLSANWTGYMSTEAEEIWLEQDGVRTKVEPEFATIHPAAAFVATVLDGAPNICPARETARVVALTESAYRSATAGRIMQVDPVAM